jgi:hypothetical protein
VVSSACMKKATATSHGSRRVATGVERISAIRPAGELLRELCGQ